MDKIKKIILVLGGPGCGKSTVCNLLAQKYGFTHIPLGQILMNEIDKGTEIGNIISKHIKSAVIIPPKITYDVFINEIMKYENDIYLIDGYPRNNANNEYLINNLPTNIKIIKLLYLKCDAKTMEERLYTRKQMTDRIDNDIDIIKKRIISFFQQTLPVIESYNKQVITIDCNDTIDNIINNIQKEIEKYCII